MIVSKIEIEKILDEVRSRFLRDDSFLISERANERTITNRIGFYLQEKFQGWHVDCEYNRAGVARDPKADSQGNRVYPDIIVHMRGTKKNLLVIEAKSALAPDSEKSDDEEKLRRIADEHGYEHAYTLIYFEGESQDISFKRIDGVNSIAHDMPPSRLPLP